jgi:hypothetical protein
MRQFLKRWQPQFSLPVLGEVCPSNKIMVLPVFTIPLPFYLQLLRHITIFPQISHLPVLSLPKQNPLLNLNAKDYMHLNKYFIQEQLHTSE